MTVPGRPGGVRAQAAAVVEEVARRLRDPDGVLRVATSSGPVAGSTDRIEVRPWRPSGLADGHEGLALLFAELGHQDGRFRRIAHAHLARAATRVAGRLDGGLLLGPAGLGFAASVAAHRPDDYAGLIATVDGHVRQEVERTVALESERMASGRAGTEMHHYDALRGLAGLGGYLLRRGHREVLDPLLASLCELTGPVTLDGVTLPGWWVGGPPSQRGEDDPELLRGHVNLGLAHGIAGPLALLALAWRAGARVPGQQEAIARIVEALLGWRVVDAGGSYWPRYLARSEVLTGVRPHPDRLAWCYGTPGVARSVQLAGLALGRPDWASSAVQTMRSALSRPELPAMMVDCTVCHGWAGLLHITGLMAHDSQDPGLLDLTDRWAGELVDRFDPRAPLGYRHWLLGVPLDQPGVLEGAAGAALALHSYAGSQGPGSWSRSLLLV